MSNYTPEKQNEYYKEYRKTLSGRERIREAQRKYKQSPKGIAWRRKYQLEYHQRDYVKARSRAYQKKSKNSHQWQWRRDGIKNKDGSQFLVSDFNQLYEDQNGRCGICDRHQSQMSHSLCLDHDHNTGIARGLLCVRCNVKLGTLEDVEFCSLAKEYVNWRR